MGLMRMDAAGPLFLSAAMKAVNSGLLARLPSAIA
jgi:hypothetical protein